MFDERTVGLFLQGTVDTIYVTLASTLFAYVFGIVMGVVLVITRKDGIRPNALVYSVLDVFVNLTRSFPFLILLIAVIPLTRLIESSLLEVDPGVVEAAQSMGASTWQIIRKVLLPEAKPSLINGSAIAATTILGYSAMAGAVGGGGLGKLAIQYGYMRYQTDVMIVTIILLIVIVQAFQSIGNWATRKCDKRSR